MSRVRQHTCAALATLLAGACQGPPIQHSAVQQASIPAIAIGASLAPLEEAFDARVEVPRVVALLPVRCADCACGLDAVRRSILRAFPDEGLHVFVVLPPGEVCDGCGADVVAALIDQRVTYFRDREGRAARTFARGLLPIAEASELFLFYPRGTRWHDAPDSSTTPNALAATHAPQATTPRVEEWWHRMGRIAPGRHCAEQELDGALSGTMARLLADAAEQRSRSGVASAHE